MNELKTLQEENIKGILKEICYPEELPNGIELANLITAMQHCFTLGIMKGVELVEGELPKYPPNSDREELVLEQIKGIINKLKQELK